jgi:hypothetical protein
LRIELYFSIVQRMRSAPTASTRSTSSPIGCCSSASTTGPIARPFDWTFTGADVERVLAKITEREPRLALAA